MLIIKNSKSIFTILLHRHSPKSFAQRWEKTFRRTAPRSMTVEMEKQMRTIYCSSKPRIHRYNDIAGFVEVYWDAGTRILTDCYMLGDRRTKYGRELAKRWPGRISGNRYYPYFSMSEGGSFSSYDKPAQKKAAIIETLDDVEKAAKRLGCYVDLRVEREIANCIDVNKLLVRPRVKTG